MRYLFAGVISIALVWMAIQNVGGPFEAVRDAPVLPIVFATIAALLISTWDVGALRRAAPALVFAVIAALGAVTGIEIVIAYSISVLIGCAVGFAVSAIGNRLAVR